MTSPFAAFGGQRIAPSRPTAGRPMPAMAQPQQGMNMAQLRNLYQSISNSANPMQALQQMMGSNPRFAQINNMMKKGMSPEGIFREMAANRGIDPNDFIRQLQGNNGK